MCTRRVITPCTFPVCAVQWRKSSHFHFPMPFSKGLFKKFEWLNESQVQSGLHMKLCMCASMLEWAAVNNLTESGRKKKGKAPLIGTGCGVDDRSEGCTRPVWQPDQTTHPPCEGDKCNDMMKRQPLLAWKGCLHQLHLQQLNFHQGFLQGRLIN